MKILHVIGSVNPENGGTTNHVFSTGGIWNRHGHECHILCLDPPDAACVRHSPLVTFAIGPRPPGKRLDGLFPFLRYGFTPALTKWLRQNAANYDVIILNGLWNYTSFGTWRALRKTNRPYFVCPHGMLDPWLRRAHPVRHALRTIFWRLVEQNIVRDSRGIFYACEEERNLAQAFVSNCNCREFVVEYGCRDIGGNGNAQKALFFAKFPRLQQRKLIVFLSRIHPKKGLDLLIKGFAQHSRMFPDFDLVIVGPDQSGLAVKLKSISAQLGIENRIHWPGMLSGDEKWGALRAAKFFVLPSHQENFGIAVVEAMALEKPVLITNKVNIWREVQESGSGYVVTDDVEGVSRGTSYFCSLAPEQIRTMGQNARSCFEKRFDLEKNALKMIGLMETLLHAGH